MEAKHTPGPWFALSGGNVTRNTGPHWAVGGIYIAQVDQKSMSCEANARLIAAAPDLAAWAVDACSIIEQAIEYSEWNATNFGRGTTFRSGGYDADYVLEALRAALRKAGVLA